MKIDILGTPYNLVTKKYDEDIEFDKRSICGYCDSYSREIVICDMKTYKGYESKSLKSLDRLQRETIRHEIVHAFLGESGLKDSTNSYSYSWAKNEEMIDWLAIQGPKIYKAWEEANAID